MSALSTVIRNSVKKPKSPYSGALKTILKMVRVRDLKFCSVSRRSLNRQEKISSFRSIGKLVFWNPCFTIDCRDTYYIQCIYTVYTGGGGGGGQITKLSSILCISLTKLTG